MIKAGKTERGFVKGTFTDRYGVECSIQESSLATEGAIWLGVEDASPKQFVPNGDPSWRPFKVPESVHFTTRMHLTQEQVRELLPLLQHFAETGYLPNGDE